MKRFVVVVMWSLLSLSLSCFHPSPPAKSVISDKAQIAYCENHSSLLASCPEGVGRIFLPRTYQARSIYIGYFRGKSHRNFVDKITEEAKKITPTPVINILIPRNDVELARLNYKDYFMRQDRHYVNFIPIPSDEGLWVQDYFELVFDTETGFTSLLDLPYSDSEGEMIPSALSLYCKKDMIHQPIKFDSKKPGNGDFGGNIEPLSEKILVVGSTITDETYRLVANETSQEVIILDVDWLETGHVDEVFSILPHKANAGPCEQTLLYSSPQKALDLLPKIEIKNLQPSMFIEEGWSGDNTWPDFFECLDIKKLDTPECMRLILANQAYEKIQRANLRKIQKAFKTFHRCELDVIAAPQLFKPYPVRDVYGLEGDDAVAFNENGVNNIFFWPNLFMAKQSIVPFQDYLKGQLERFAFKLHFVEGKTVHRLLGGIHCATNVSYGCNPNQAKD